MKIAIVGSTGSVGSIIMQILEDSEINVSELIPLASKESKGKKVSFRGKTLETQVVSEYDFSKADVALFSAGSGVSEVYGTQAAKKGCIVIDNTSFFRMNDDVPLVIPEINPEAIADYKKKNIIANPNCSTIQMLIALAPLHKKFHIKRIVVSTYQSVSGAGKSGMDELFSETKNIFVNKDPVSKIFTKPIAFNCIPHIDTFMEDGYTKEEWKMSVETKKILDSNIKVTATCVRVPVFVGHAEAVNVEFYDPIDIDDIFDTLGDAEGLIILDRQKDGGYMTPAEISGRFEVYVSRLRIDETIDNGLNMWVVADNLRKGAALNAVQILEILEKEYL